MKFHVLSKNQRGAARFRAVNRSITPIFYHDVRSYLSVASSIIADETTDYAILTQDNVFFPEDFSSIASSLVEKLDAEWPNWGLCGNAGISAFSFGHKAANIVRYLFDNQSGPNASEFIIPAQTLDAAAILLNCRALRKACLSIPDFDGFEFHSVILSVECTVQGLAVVAAPEMACFHSGSTNTSDFNKLRETPSLKHYLSTRLLNSQIATTSGPMRVPLSMASNRIDLEMMALSNAALLRPRKKLNILIRSQFRQPEMLKRTLQTARAFSVATRPHVTTRVIVATDKGDKAPAFVRHWSDKIVTFDPYDAEDSRSLLIRDGLFADKSDFTWIVDDDDWVFPNEALRLALVLCVSPPSCVVFLDSRHFAETFASNGPIMASGYSIHEDRYFPAKFWSGSLGGVNHIPICGMIIATDLLKATPGRVFSRLEYLEDYALQLFSLQATRFPPIVLDKQFAGISIRDPAGAIPNSVNERDRTKWNRSLAELSYLLAQSKSNVFPIMSLPSMSNNSIASNDLTHRERNALMVIRVLRGVSLFFRNPKKTMVYVRSAREGYMSRGLRGLLSTLAHATR